MGGYYNTQTYEAIARNVIKKYDPSLLSNAKAIPIENIIEKQYGLKLEYQYIRNNGRLLGETIFDDTWIPVYDMEKKEYTFVFAKRGTIIIDASLINNRGDGRLRFTCAHELAHWIIHQDIFSGSGQTAAMTKKTLKSSDTNAAIERQADMLSTALLMPLGTVKVAFYQSFHTAGNIVEHLANEFAVSKQAMEIRLKSSNLI